MKMLLNLIFLSFIIICFSFISLDDVISGIKKGDAAEVSKYFDNTIEITLPDKSNSYSKSQAELVLRDFFNTNSIKDFEVLQRGDNDAGSQYCTGTLQTKNGIFRTSIFLKQKGDKQLLKELRFER